QTLGRGSHTRGELTGRNPLPILTHRHRKDLCMRIRGCRLIDQVAQPGQLPSPRTRSEADLTHAHLIPLRSEEHTSELQSRFDLVCRLLLEKKKTISSQ